MPSSTPSRSSHAAASTPQHAQVARLRPSNGLPRASSMLTPPRTSSNRGARRSVSPAESASNTSRSNSDDVNTVVDDVFNASSAVASPPARGTPSRRPGGVRIVKSKKPWMQRILAVPRDLWDTYEMSLSESLALALDEQGKLGYSAGFVALGTHVALRTLLFTSRALVSAASKDHLHHHHRRAQTAAEARYEEILSKASAGTAAAAASALRGSVRRGGGSILLSLINLTCWTMVILSIANAIWLFSRRRKYTMFLRQDPIQSPNAKTVVVDSSIDETTSSKTLTHRLGSKVFNLLKNSIFGGKSASHPDDMAPRIQELSIWTPPIFSLRFFSIYSPPLALTCQLLSRNNFLPFTVAASFLLLQTWYVVRIYSQTMEDRQTLNREVMYEYDTKFVNPRINYSRREVAVQTVESGTEPFWDESWLPKHSDAYGGADARKGSRRSEGHVAARPLGGPGPGPGPTGTPRKSTSSSLGSTRSMGSSTSMYF